MNVCPFDVESIHSLEERIDVFLRQIEPVNTVFGRSVDDFVVHIGEVLNAYDVDAAILHVGLQHLKDHRRQSVA